MATEKIYSVLALTVYEASDENRLELQANWSRLPNPIVGTSGFAYAVYKNSETGEIVISYRGTDALFSGDMLTNLGLSASQERQAAEVYARVLNTTFTGHSLGGGLAATMAVWFNRPAVVFDPAPSELAAKHQPHVSNVIASLGAGAPQSIKDYSANINAQFAARESRDGGEDVATHYQLKSCSRTYPSTRSMIRYPKTVRKASHDVCRSRKRARSGTRFTPNSIAGCAHKQGASGTFDGKSRLKRSQNQTFLIKGVSA